MYRDASQPRPTSPTDSVHEARAAVSPCARTPGPRLSKGPRPLRSLVALLAWLCLLSIAAGCASKPPSFEDVPPAEELYAQGLKTLEGRRILGLFTMINYDKAIEQFQAIIDNYPYSEYEEKAQLQIAGAYFDDSRYEEALAYYQDFADLHPMHPRVPYTLLQAARCHYNQIESIERDQNATRRATEILEVLIREHPYAEETRIGEEMMIDLRKRLARNMLHIADFYLDRTHWQAAATRYQRVLDEYPGLGLDAKALFRLGLCLEKMRLDDEALRLYHVVVENYSDTASARQARNRIADYN
ncbi:MAG: outer membrane protein assembly factor BamD [Deltaproteobacteria bacterium]|nr:outer membrane protein assembly factor BamD [Deltaproteobacteria bacterium]MBW2500086.1 outer membrane protein assembly factor BamD [Deltaproteobacteria bacterium]